MDLNEDRDLKANWTKLWSRFNIIDSYLAGTESILGRVSFPG